jgi:phosphate acetyltransferase
MLEKKLWFLANPDAARIVFDARVPITLTSRANTVRARMTFCGAALCLADALRKQAGMPKTAK